MIFNSLFK